LREVEERRPAAFVDVPVDSLGRIEAALAEADAIVIGGGDEIAPGELPPEIDRGQSRFDLATGVDGRTSVEIGPARRGGGRSVVVLLRRRRHEHDLLDIDAEFVRDELPDLRVDALSHLRG